MSPEMKRLMAFAQETFPHVVVGVMAGVLAPPTGVGIEFTLQRKSQRWGFRLREETTIGRRLFFVVEQRPRLYHYGMRSGSFRAGHPDYPALDQWHPHPTTLLEMVEAWPAEHWPEGLHILTAFAKNAKRKSPA